MSGLDILLDEFIVTLAAHAGVTHPKVAIVVKTFHIVGTDVENDREHAVRVNPCSCGVYG